MRALEFARRRSKIEHCGRGDAWKKRALHNLILDSRATLIMSSDSIVGWQLDRGEIVCVKQRYRNYERAVSQIDMIANMGNAPTKPVRAYHCSHCHGWHLTSHA